MVFSIVVPDVGQAPSSYTSTNGFITNVTVSLGNTGEKAYYTVTVDTTKVFGGDDYYIMYSVRSLRGALSDLDNDFSPIVTALYSKSSFTFYWE
jgi:hypothetical protein